MIQAISRVTAAASLIVLVMAVNSPVIADGTHMPSPAASGIPGAPPRIDQLVPQGIPGAPLGAAAAPGAAASSSLSAGVEAWNPGAYVDPATGRSYASYDAFQQSQGANGASNTTGYRNFPADGLPPRLFYPFYPNSPYYGYQRGGSSGSASSAGPPPQGVDQNTPQGIATAPPAGAAGSIAASPPSTPSTGAGSSATGRYIDPATGYSYSSYDDYVQYQRSRAATPNTTAYRSFPADGLSPRLFYRFYRPNGNGSMY